jgi:23S rRNA pseudouridine2604 synthase
MCEYLGYDVIGLKRIRIINISLDIPMGRYRDLTDAEIKELNELIEPSSKTEASLPRTETPKGEQNSSKKTTQVQEKGDY